LGKRLPWSQILDLVESFTLLLYKSSDFIYPSQSSQSSLFLCLSAFIKARIFNLPNLIISYMLVTFAFNKSVFSWTWKCLLHLKTQLHQNMVCIFLYQDNITCSTIVGSKPYPQILDYAEKAWLCEIYNSNVIDEDKSLTSSVAWNIKLLRGFNTAVLRAGALVTASHF